MTSAVPHAPLAPMYPHVRRYQTGLHMTTATARHTKANARARLARIGIAPRGLPLEEAAAYVNLSGKAFLEEVEAGHYPRALQHRASTLTWDRRALDLAIDRLSGLASPSAENLDTAHVTAAMDKAIENAEV